MRTAIFYDTETTGLPEFKLPSDDPKQPHIIQLAAELVDLDTRRTIAGFSHIIKPAGWTVPPNVEALTGISTERAAQFGVDIKVVLPLFLELWAMATEGRIAHNDAFDTRLVRIAIKRDGEFPAGLADQWKAAPAFCTMRESAAIVNLPPTSAMAARGMKGPKSPNLGEAYRHFTGQELVNAHDALADVGGCKAIYFALQDLRQAETA